jgi:hypothetical protein
LMDIFGRFQSSKLPSSPPEHRRVYTDMFFL